MRIGRGRGSRRSRSYGFGRDQNFAQANVFWLLHFRLVIVVELLFFFFADGEMAADFFANHFPGDDLIALLLLEIFPGDALLFRFFLKSLQGIELHVFAHLIELLDQFGIAGDAEVFGLCR